jgi:protocatechuate 3,4-dioxygenase beta subunit
MKSSQKIQVSFFSLVFLMLGFLVLPVIGQQFVVAVPASTTEKDNEKTLGPFTGTVVDSADKPVAGATVWLLGGVYPGDPIVKAETTTDEKGQFQIAAMKWEDISETSFPRVRPPMLSARDSQGRIGGQIRYYRRAMSEDQSKAFENVQIKLQDVKDYQGRLVDAAGQPITKATVKPLNGSYQKTEEQYYISYEFPASLRNELATETAEDGSFTIRNLPVQGRLALVINAEGFGKPWARLNLEKSATIKISRPGNIHGSITCAKDPQAVAGIKIQLYISSAVRERRERLPDCEVGYSDVGLTQKDGTFQFENVLPGTGSVYPELPESCPYYVADLSPVEVKSGETCTISWELKPAVKVQGKVVDQETGEGVSGVYVMFYYQDGVGGGRQKPATTDAKGEFTIYTRPGKANINIWQIPDQYVTSQQTQTIEIKEDTTLEPIKLARASLLEGIVVDESGNPVADAEIRCNAMDMSAPYMADRDVRSDASGKFVLKKTLPKQSFSIRARSKKAASEPLSFTVGESKPPIRLVVNEKTSFALRGAVVDDAGRPIPNAEISTTLHLWFGNWGTSSACDSSKTDAAGKFEIAGLWPGDKYDIRISASGFEKYGSKQITGTPGGTHDFGKIALVGAGNVVEGTVVDSSGNPIPDVRVFNSGDGPEPMETRSDNAGKFQLKGFRKGPVFVFADKEGFRFTGLKTNAGATDAVLKMLKTDEPIAQPSPLSTSLKEAEKQAARAILEKMWATTTGSQRRWARYKMAQIDPELAGKWAAEAKVKPEDILEPKIAINKAAQEDLEEAISLIAKQGGQAYYLLKDLVNNFAQSDPEKALRCAEEAVVRARSMDQPQRAIGLAQMGALVTRLGNKEAGQKLIEEAVAMAEKFKPSDRNNYTLGTIAVAVGSSDISRAESLLAKIPEKNERDRFVANLAASLDDLDKAESLLKEIEPWYAQRARMRLACRIAAKRPADAIRLIENIPSQYGREEEEKAKAFGWLAAIIAPQDQKLAHGLIDRAFAIYLKPADRSFGNYGGRAAQAAVLVVEAHQAGYPDMESAIYRMLAVRPTTKDAWSPVAVQESVVVMAMYLALIDPQSAKQLLQSIEPTSDSIGSGYSGVGRDEWLKAWALADPQHALELADLEKTSAKDQNEKQRAEYALREMVELWVKEPGERLKILGRYQDMLPPEDDF